jgi:hypothetical protein
MLILKNKSFAVVLGSVGLLAGCENEVSFSVGQTEVSTVQPPAVCDPFGGAGDSGSIQGGLHARLFYLQPDQPQYTSVEDYVSQGTQAPTDLFFSQLNVPTRPFDRGFVLQDGSVLTRPGGDTLYEWFALQFDSRVRLAPDERAAKYQLAVLSDDGSIVRVDRGQGLETLINNDGLTPTRLACARSTVRMDALSLLPLQVDYYQGPRYHIALQLLWREIPDASDELADPGVLDDPACGLSGNDVFFDSTQNPSAPTAIWQGLMDRGWKVLNPRNYLLPTGFESNPCALGGGPPPA